MEKIRTVQVVQEQKYNICDRCGNDVGFRWQPKLVLPDVLVDADTNNVHVRRRQYDCCMACADEVEAMFTKPVRASAE